MAKMPDLRSHWLAKSHGLFAVPKSWLAVFAQALTVNLEFRTRSRSMRYAVVIEKSDNRFCAYVPDLPGFMKTGASIDEIEADIHDAIVHHLDSLCDDGSDIPAPTAIVEYCELTA
jgi:predicted RNase H-like HicB family nuclease